MTDKEDLAASIRRLLEAHGIKVEPATMEELRTLRRRAREWAEGVRRKREDA